MILEEYLVIIFLGFLIILKTFDSIQKIERLHSKVHRKHCIYIYIYIYIYTLYIYTHI